MAVVLSAMAFALLRVLHLRLRWRIAASLITALAVGLWVWSSLRDFYAKLTRQR